MNHKNQWEASFRYINQFWNSCIDCCSDKIFSCRNIILPLVNKSQISSWCPHPCFRIPTLAPPSPSPNTPSHSKWTHNCRSSGETVTNCRESPIYDVSSDQPFGHLFQREILQVLDLFLKKRRTILSRFWKGSLVHCFMISQPELATFYDHCTSFNTAVYDRCISPTLNCCYFV